MARKKHLPILRLPDGSSISLWKLRAAASLALSGEMTPDEDDIAEALDTPIRPMTDDEKQAASVRAELTRDA